MVNEVHIWVASLERLSNDGDQVQQLECKPIYGGQVFEGGRKSVSEVNIMLPA